MAGGYTTIAFGYDPTKDVALQSLYDIAAQYAPKGSIYEQVTGIQKKTAELAEKTYQAGKTKSLSKIAQSLVSARLSKTPGMVGAELAYESEVGGPMRESMALEAQKIGIGLEEKRLGYMGEIAQRISGKQTEAAKAAQQWLMESAGTSIPSAGGITSLPGRTAGTAKTGAEIAASMGGTAGAGGELLPSGAIGGLKEQYAKMTGGGTTVSGAGGGSQTITIYSGNPSVTGQSMDATKTITIPAGMTGEQAMERGLVPRGWSTARQGSAFAGGGGGIFKGTGYTGTW